MTRVNAWTDKFFAYLEKDNKDLIFLFQGRIHFIPQYNPEIIHPALMELDDRYATKEQIERMSKVISEFAKTNEV